MSLWLFLIVLHAVSAIICFAAVIALLSPPRVKRYPVLIKIFLISLIGMIIFMVFATISHWNDLSVAERIVFSGLPILGLYMLYRGLLAMKKIKGDMPVEYIDDIGFALISLFNGFIIVGLIDLGAPPFLTPVVGVAGTVLGSKYIKSIKLRLTDK
jgi:hypothetical protein